MVLEGAGKEAAEELAKLGGDVAGQLNVRLLEANQAIKDFKASVDRVLAAIEAIQGVDVVIGGQVVGRVNLRRG